MILMSFLDETSSYLNDALLNNTLGYVWERTFLKYYNLDLERRIMGFWEIP